MKRSEALNGADQVLLAACALRLAALLGTLSAHAENMGGDRGRWDGLADLKVLAAHAGVEQTEAVGMAYRAGRRSKLPAMELATEAAA